MKTKTKKLALYRSQYGSYFAFEMYSENDDSVSGYTRVSEPVEVEFTMLPETPAKDKLNAIEAKKRELQKEIDKLDVLRTELLGAIS